MSVPPATTTSIFNRQKVYQLVELKSRKLSDDKYFYRLSNLWINKKGCELFRPQPFVILQVKVHLCKLRYWYRREPLVCKNCKVLEVDCAVIVQVCIRRPWLVCGQLKSHIP